MIATVLLSVVAAPADDIAVAHRMVQLAPARAVSSMERTVGQARAVLLVHGLRFGAAGHEVTDATPSDWQEPGSQVVRALAPYADVFAFCYGQNAGADRIASRLQGHVRELRSRGYGDIVLVGHSAGGILVRHFVEDFPEAGATKAIQVACPNAGCPSASDIEVDKRQRAYLESLTKAGRRAVLQQRQQVRIPQPVQFICVVGKLGALKSDLAVPVRCQWTHDLQEQRVPCYVLENTKHMTTMQEPATAQLLSDLIRRDCPRWSKDEVQATCKRLFPAE